MVGRLGLAIQILNCLLGRVFSAKFLCVTKWRKYLQYDNSHTRQTLHRCSKYQKLKKCIKIEYAIFHKNIKLLREILP